MWSPAMEEVVDSRLGKANKPGAPWELFWLGCGVLFCCDVVVLVVLVVLTAIA